MIDERVTFFSLLAIVRWESGKTARETVERLESEDGYTRKE